MYDAATLDLDRHLAAQARADALENAIDSRASALLQEPEFIWDFIGDVDQGNGIRDYAVLAIAKAVIDAATQNAALAYRLSQLARKAAREQVLEGENPYQV